MGHFTTVYELFKLMLSIVIERWRKIFITWFVFAFFTTTVFILIGDGFSHLGMEAVMFGLKWGTIVFLGVCVLVSIVVTLCLRFEE